MKKWLWAIPVCMILVTSVAIGILNTREIDPDAMIASVEPRDIAPMSEAEVLTLIEQDQRFETSDLEVIEETETLRLYVTKTAAETPDPQALNHKVYTRDLGNGWTYVLEYVCGITFTNQYLDQLEDELGEGLTVVYYLRDKTLCADPGTRSKSAYAGIGY